MERPTYEEAVSLYSSDPGRALAYVIAGQGPAGSVAGTADATERTQALLSEVLGELTQIRALLESHLS